MRGPGDAQYLHSALAAEGLTVAGMLPYEEDVAEADRAGTAGTAPRSPALQAAVEAVLDAVDAAGRD